MRRWLAVLTSLLSLQVAAAVSYTVRQKSTEAKVIADNGRIRVTSARSTSGPVLRDGLLFTEKGLLIALNSQNQTWYELEKPSPLVPSFHFLNPVHGAQPKKVRTVFDEVPSNVAGERRYAGKVTYDLFQGYGTGTVKVSCGIAFEVTTTDAVARRNWPGGLLPVTGYKEVDAKLAEIEAAFPGFPLRLSLEPWRQFEGGPKTSDPVTLEIADVRETTANAAMFRVPEGYRQQAPQIGTPGR